MRSIAGIMYIFKPLKPADQIRQILDKGFDGFNKYRLNNVFIGKNVINSRLLRRESVRLSRLKLALIGFVFEASESIHFHNPLLILYLRSFGHLVNWVCIGFVFEASAKAYIDIIVCYNSTYVHLSIQQIGFVLHKKS